MPRTAKRDRMGLSISKGLEDVHDGCSGTESAWAGCRRAFAFTLPVIEETSDLQRRSAQFTQLCSTTFELMQQVPELSDLLWYRRPALWMRKTSTLLRCSWRNSETGSGWR